MSFKEGELVGKTCPLCGKNLIYYMGFQDCFSHTTGHYTIDAPLIVCEDDSCDYMESVEE